MKYQISINQVVTDYNQNHIKTTHKWLEDTQTENLDRAFNYYCAAIASIEATENASDYENVYTVQLIEQSRGDGWYPVKSKTIIKGNDQTR